MNIYFYLRQVFLIIILFIIQPVLSNGNIVPGSSNMTRYVADNNFSSGNEIARKFGVHEVTLKTGSETANPFKVDCNITFYAPSKKKITVYAFYDGGNIWRARLYVNETGIWKWKSSCSDVPELNKQKGAFKSVDSGLRGMLSRHPENPKAWMTDDGKWFLNINDTGYLLFNKHEKLWKRYIEDLSKLGVTSVRAGSLGGETWDKNSDLNRYLREAYPKCGELYMDNYPWDEKDSSKMNLDRFQTTDERLIWMLNNYPDMYIQFILFGLQTWGKDDSGKLWKSVPLNIRNNTMKYMIARWSAFPQLFYLIVNDMHCSEKYPNNQAYAREIGRYFAANDPWHHLISSGPNRTQEFPFTSDEDLEWVSYIHIEDNMALDASKIRLYESYPLHVFLGEDWYENTKPANGNDWFENTKSAARSISILNPDYFYRWLFWSWTLSGGSANYGGRWARLQPYFLTDSLEYTEPLGGRQKFNAQMSGLNSVKFIGKFFYDQKIDLSEFIPDHEFVSDMDNRADNGFLKLMRKGMSEFIIYHPNARVKGISAMPDTNKTIHFRIDFGGMNKTFEGKWYRPDSGESINTGMIKGERKVDFEAPWKGADAVLYLKESGIFSFINQIN